MTSASVYRFKDRWLVAPDNKTTTGLQVGLGPFVALPLDITTSDLGSALAKALDLSKRTIPHPTDWKSVALPRLAAAGVKSERTFQLGAILVRVSGEGPSLTFTPTHNGGAAGVTKGFHSLPDLALEIFMGSDDLLGEALCKAIERCS